MRVYEYAKLHGISSKEIIQCLQDLGQEVKSHMTILGDDAVRLLDEKFNAPKTASKTSPSSLVEPKTEVAKEENLKKASEPLKIIEKPAAKVEVKPEPTPVRSADQSRSRYEQKPREDAKPALRAPIAPAGIIVTAMSVSDFADKAKKPVSEVILSLLRQGVAAAKNQIISEKVVEQLAQTYGLPILKPEGKSHAMPSAAESMHGLNVEERLPIVVVIGHVDHGKTTLLDFIRETRVASRERGGITQHLGAYEANTRHGNLVFLDTPGHAAFSKMRERGTRVADIAILIVAADDGIMPQTVEAIKAAESAKIPLVVAINKTDKASAAQIENVKRSLTQYGLVAEDWGGQTICVPISAKNGTGVDELLEVLVLQSKLMELTASLEIPARGYILESKIEKGRGPVATVLCQHGILRVGDYFVAGSRSGKVSSLVDSWGKRVIEVRPSQPVQVAGFDELPQAGDLFEVVSRDQQKKSKNTSVRTLPASRSVLQDKGINVILKVDNDSTREALLDAVEKINHKAYMKFNVISAAIGNVTESDIQLAQDTQAVVYTLHSKIESGASALSVKYGVAIHQYDIIYKILEALEVSAEAGRPIKMITKKVGEAVVLKVFDIKNIGVIAGAQVRSGKLVKDAKVTIWRGKFKVGEGKLTSLQREKRTIKEATAGLECAFVVSGFVDWIAEDRVECFQDVPE